MDIIPGALEFSSLAPGVIEDEIVISSDTQNYEDRNEMDARKIRDSKYHIVEEVRKREGQACLNHPV